MNLVITIIDTIFNVLTYFVVIYSLLTFFMDPYHPVRSAMARIAEPMLLPIRKLIPPLGGFDVSPIVLIFIFQILGSLVVRLLRSF